MLADQMTRTADLQEQTVHGEREFPLQYYVDELHRFRDRQVPLHWHQSLEFLVCGGGEVLAQAGSRERILHPGEGVFINANVLHRFSQIGEEVPCPCPNIVFSAELIGAGIPLIAQRYVTPLVMDRTLPFVFLRPEVPWQRRVLEELRQIFVLEQFFGGKGSFEEAAPIYGPEDLPWELRQAQGAVDACVEMRVQVLLSQIWQEIVAHRQELPREEEGAESFVSLIRLQQMMGYIQDHFAEPVSLQEIAVAAGVGRSEAGRCFQKYLHCAPVEYLADYRIRQARTLLQDGSLSVAEVSRRCGFSSPGYFGRVFSRQVGCTPSQYRRQLREGRE